MNKVEELNRQKKERAIWDKQASGYDNRVLKMYKDTYDLSIQKVLSILSPDRQLLDIGCGTGIISLGIAPYVDKVVATDISPQMVSMAKNKAESSSITNVDFQVYDGYAVPYDDESFDVVLLFNTLHVVKEPDALLREAHRLLKPGGHLVTATDCYAEPVPFLVRLGLSVQKLLKLLGVISFMWYYRKEDLHQLFEQTSFLIADSDVLHPAPVNYYLLASKK
ncbi:MAG: class I SAM-dependent methyltransferase [Anaerolineales bacterium]|jgi:ubiquinone/menaquinone biosynthesis C-methylase UbiE